LGAAGICTTEIQRPTGKGKPTIWRWQARFVEEEVDGLLHDATRPRGKPGLTPAPKFTRQRLKRGVFTGIADLQAAINRDLAEANDNPKPFAWTADSEAIIEKLRRGKQALEPIH
jgi:hypothetical protein